MNFEWDDRKNQSNLKKHGIAFEEAALIFRGITFSTVDDRKDYGEKRTITIGKIADQIPVTVLHTDRDGRVRISSARLASRKERKIFDDYCSQIPQ